jgi:hypothetical protein
MPKHVEADVHCSPNSRRQVARTDSTRMPQETAIKTPYQIQSWRVEPPDSKKITSPLASDKLSAFTGMLSPLAEPECESFIVKRPYGCARGIGAFMIPGMRSQSKPHHYLGYGICVALLVALQTRRMTHLESYKNSHSFWVGINLVCGFRVFFHGSCGLATLLSLSTVPKGFGIDRTWS